MTIPSFDNEIVEGLRVKPRIQMLEIRDRERPVGKPIAWLLVERQETYRRDTPDGQVYEAIIRLSYELITPRYTHHQAGKGDFVGRYSMLDNSVSLSSATSFAGAVFLDLNGFEGQRIGTYLMNEIVMWVQRWPDADVNSVALLSGQGADDNRERRNRFWEQFGLEFDYSDLVRQAGHSRAMLVKELTPTEAWKQNITERRMQDYLADVLYAEQRAVSELDRLTNALHRRVAEIKKAEDKPIRWVLKTLYFKYGGIMVGGSVLAVFATALWWNLRG